MSAVLEQPKPEIFPSVGFFDKRVVGANVVRWVGFFLDLIVSERKAEISWLKVGGEETPNPCLQRYGRGFVPRGRAALLELGGEPIPMQHLGDLQAVAWQGIPLNEDAVKNKFGFVPVFPGDGLRILRRYSMNPIRKGMDEFTVLLGKEWDECHNAEGDGILDVIETAMFGDGMEPTLRGIEEQIKSAVINDTRIDVGKYKSEALTMCNDSRNWASRLISVEHGLLKTGHVGEWQGGWSYSYSPICEMLINQLEIPRQDQPMQELAKMFANQPAQVLQPQGMSAADMDMFERRMDAKLAAAREADARRIAELEAQLAEPLRVKVDENVTSETTQFLCKGCEAPFDTKQGVEVHERRWCKVLNAETSEQE
jgi:hypothetical protein